MNIQNLEEGKALGSCAINLLASPHKSLRPFLGGLLGKAVPKGEEMGMDGGSFLGTLRPFTMVSTVTTNTCKVHKAGEMRQKYRNNRNREIF